MSDQPRHGFERGPHQPGEERAREGQRKRQRRDGGERLHLESQEQHVHLRQGARQEGDDQVEQEQHQQHDPRQPDRHQEHRAHIFDQRRRIAAQARGAERHFLDRGRPDREQVLGCADREEDRQQHRIHAHRDADAAIDAGFIGARIEAALALRERLFDTPFYRLVHAEADGLPGLIIDRYDDVFVCQPNTAGMTRLFPELLAALEARFSPRAVVLRGDSPARTREGLELESRVAAGALDGPVELVEDGVRFLADLAEGQKSGWYFDQRDSRAFIARLATGRSLLDVYSHSGGFALAAAARGAARVTAVDRSQAALDLGARAAELNGLAAQCRFVCAEAFGEMERLGEAGERFDLVVVDPPSFVKSRKDIKPGLRGYRKMARLAARLVTPGGVLFAASCSYNAAADAFAEAVR
ncbi:MAG: class I SAM-dependent methyltransferase, partial [Proteobacteria bacterium]|nr:class I SAM-dependent methyltransferase [Pseudomonadota bacterium]